MAKIQIKSEIITASEGLFCTRESFSRFAGLGFKIIIGDQCISYRYQISVPFFQHSGYSILTFKHAHNSHRNHQVQDGSKICEY